MTLPARLHRKPKRDNRVRSAAHLKWVRTFRCVVPGCDKTPIEAAHVRNYTDGGMGMKPGDDWTVSMCRDHHREQHRIGEIGFALGHGINLAALAQEFAVKSPHLRKLRHG